RNVTKHFLELRHCTVPVLCGQSMVDWLQRLKYAVKFFIVVALVSLYLRLLFKY
ncbi:unnamed protein product, partial [Tenebrio molitor]